MKKQEEQVKVFTELPDNHVEIDNGRYIIPIDNIEMYGSRPNANFGNPRLQQEFRRNATFIGTVDGEMGKYDFNYKGESCKVFSPDTFKLVHFTCIINSNDASKIHGATDKTLLSLVYNEDLDDGNELKVEDTSVNFADVLMEQAGDNYSPLVDLERYHGILLEKPYKDRFVHTFGTVTNVNMTPTSNGNRILNLTDLSMDFAFDDGSSFGTTCWVPSHINIDFGIGSSVIVVGRTSQGTDEDGNLRQVSLNVTGLHAVEKRGGIDETVEVKEDNLGWF